MKIEIAVPVLNEAETLVRQVGILRRVVDRLSPTYGTIAIAIADNGSNDDTPALARELAMRDPSLRYLRLDRPGVGRALQTVWDTSSADIVGFTDLDLSTDLRHLPAALELLADDRADLVSGSRLIAGAEVIGRPLHRTVSSVAFNRLRRVVLKSRLTDTQCGFKFMHRRHLDALRGHGTLGDGWFFLTELMSTAERAGLRVHELPVEFLDDPHSKVRVSTLAPSYLVAMWRLRRHLNSRPMRA